MLKHVELSELQIGMFVHKMDGGWFDHPFWKSNFLIEDNKRLQILRSSKLRGVVIDTAKGKDVSTPAPQARAPSAPVAVQASALASKRIRTISNRSKHEAAPVKPITIAQELYAAEKIAAKARDNLHKAFIAARLGRALNVKAVEPVVSDILDSVKRNPHAFSSLMRCKLQNELMFRHALSVSALMVSLGRKMKLPEPEIRNCGLAGLMLDIGVNYLPQTLDPPNGDFRNAEPKIWQQHVMLGYRALANEDDLPKMVLDTVLEHHERIDGGGFPKALFGHQISKFARMAAICDTFDFLLSQTSATTTPDPATVIQQMKAMTGAFDEDILRDFIESVGLYPVGSFVRLHSDKLAMVIDEDRKDHTRPVVQAFYSLTEGRQIKPHRIALARPGEEDRIRDIADLTGLDLPEPAYLRERLFLSTYKNSS
jgi:HD-GYP domain-containing protein (c-di-GMP phosphodiesterase class II)